MFPKKEKISDFVSEAFQWLLATSGAIALGSFMHYFNEGKASKGLLEIISFFQKNGLRGILSLSAFIVGFVVAFVGIFILAYFTPPKLRESWKIWALILPVAISMLFVIILAFFTEPYLGWLLLVIGTFSGILMIKRFFFNKKVYRFFALPKIREDGEYIQYQVSQATTVIVRCSDNFVSPINTPWEQRKMTTYRDLQNW